MTANHLPVVTVFSLLALLLFVLNCAEVAAPPGGEEDRLSPTVTQTSPVHGSINVSSGNEIIFWFSEGIVKPTATKPVFISPRQAIPPKLRWKTDRLIVTLADAFASNQTYVVTLSAEITDWRRNKMDSTVSIAFSTGGIIDSSTVSGFITSQGKPKSGVLACLYEIPAESLEIEFDSVYPTYVTQSAADGSFRFKFLPDKKFRLIAFEDLNRNERYNPADEPFAVSDRAINTGSSTNLNGLYLELSEPLKKNLAVVSAFYTTDGLIKIHLNRKIELNYLKHHLNLISFSSIKEPSHIVTGKAIFESHLVTSSSLTVYTEKIDTGGYVISIMTDSGSTPIIFGALTIGELKDKNPPVLIKFSPENKPHFKKKIELSALFSEPIDKARTTSESFVLTTIDTQSVNIRAEWIDPFHIMFTADSLVDGAHYTMSMAEFELFDLSGNVLGDSIQSFNFSIIDTDSLGSISGTVAVDFPDKLNSVNQLTFTGISGNQSFEIKVMGNSFTTELPSGKYLLSGYLDENNNGQRDFGSASPYAYAETFTKSADTISVRARFETAGIEFKFK